MPSILYCQINFSWYCKTLVWENGDLNVSQLQINTQEFTLSCKEVISKVGWGSKAKLATLQPHPKESFFYHTGEGIFT